MHTTHFSESTTSVDSPLAADIQPAKFKHKGTLGFDSVAQLTVSLKSSSAELQRGYA